jgi:trans-2,3-dihydro-3-hydroxyanthranilate isomerase
MKQYSYRLLNVFAIGDDRFSGNPLCVFEDGRGLSDAQMQALALQFNLSETTFILPTEEATAHVRIFTPTFEMNFAGHPTLGTAHVVRALLKAGDSVTLKMRAGIIPVTAKADFWTLKAAFASSRPVDATREQLAHMLGLEVKDIGEKPLWVSTGSEQQIIPLTSAEAVDRASPKFDELQKFGMLGPERILTYVFADIASETIPVRFFFSKGTSVVEDPATGSACANLGGWFLATQRALPVKKTLEQGRHINRPCKLQLEVTAAREIYVSGSVIELGRGAIAL